MLYQIKDGTVSAGGQTILSHIDFYIKEKEKIAVVGKGQTPSIMRSLKSLPIISELNRSSLTHRQQALFNASAEKDVSR